MAGITVSIARHIWNQLLHVCIRTLQQKHVIRLVQGEREQALIGKLPVLAMGKVFLEMVFGNSLRNHFNIWNLSPKKIHEENYL